MSSSIVKRVLIVGGGVAGLSAAATLRKHPQFQVTLLEGMPRLGGRVYSIKMGENWVEVGAQWVHGEEGNSVFHLAQEYLDRETDMLKFQEDAMFLMESGEVVDAYSSISSFLKNLYDEESQSSQDGTDGSERGKDDLKSFGCYAHFINKDPKTGKEILNASLLDWVHRYQNNIDGCGSWFDTSNYGHKEYKECKGNPTISWKHPNAYSTLIDIILGEGRKEGDWIHKEKTVTGIDYSTDTEIKLTCSDGTKYTADIVILTVSLGHLKEFHERLFTPPLQETRVLAINNLGFGTVNKIHLKFRERWWQPNCVGFNLLWNEPSKENFNLNADDEILGKEINGLPLWSRSLLGFFTSQQNPLILNSWISGPPSRYMEKLPLEQVSSICHKILRKFLGTRYEIVDAEEVQRSTWHSNSLTRGSYSFRSVKSQDSKVWAENLAEPIYGKNNEPKIYFAGEATHSHFYSTVHGAYDSGAREANRLISVYQQ